ncbi:hypothetical protein FOZ62_022325 [Perkinsus olseni]|uniref:Uncharacterized protein n=2 Tax=Perkinsus olseni TaxID=32597 RepID=A0A7J6U528_PEROL|nr:hypothetical protein FOZ62_022325 [Perkinsus olseni]
MPNGQLNTEEVQGLQDEQDMEGLPQSSTKEQQSSMTIGSPRRLNFSRRVLSSKTLPCRDEIELVSSEAVAQVQELEAQRETLLSEIKQLRKRRHVNQVRIRKTTNQLDEGNALAVDLAKKCEVLEDGNIAKRNTLKGARRDYDQAEKKVSEQEKCSDEMSRQLLAIRAEVLRTKPNVLSARKQLGVVETEKDRIAASVGRIERECKATSTRMNDLTRHSAELTRSLHEALAEGSSEGSTRKPFGAAAR